MIYICFNDNIILAGGREIACLFHYRPSPYIS